MVNSYQDVVRSVQSIQTLLGHSVTNLRADELSASKVIQALDVLSQPEGQPALQRNDFQGHSQTKLSLQDIFKLRMHTNLIFKFLNDQKGHTEWTSIDVPKFWNDQMQIQSKGHVNIFYANSLAGSAELNYFSNKKDISASDASYYVFASGSHLWQALLVNHDVSGVLTFIGDTRTEKQKCIDDGWEDNLSVPASYADVDCSNATDEGDWHECNEKKKRAGYQDPTPGGPGYCSVQ